ncbi:hypothetical protein E2C01_099237 [Portunus trituberculatus]|uniref:Uncharacterized protein n=1 Tax=Portunus trituberculatus TaxID=210409 RepID=A0A5B7K9U1_PORTR|nr:hypothetical protein [Portunus trituberculatus]
MINRRLTTDDSTPTHLTSAAVILLVKTVWFLTTTKYQELSSTEHQAPRNINYQASSTKYHKAPSTKDQALGTTKHQASNTKPQAPSKH